MDSMTETFKSAIKHGDFTLHSGEQTNWIFDTLTILDDLNLNYGYLASKFPIYLEKGKLICFGIEFGGAIIAQRLFNTPGIIRKNGDVYIPKFYKKIYHSGTIIPALNDKVMILDDVVTTESSMRWAEDILKKKDIEVDYRGCILDRRSIDNRKEYPIYSLVTWEQIMDSRL